MRTINLQHPLVCASVCAGERYEYTSAQWNGRGGWRYLNDLHAFDLTTKVFMLNHTACMQCCIRHAEAFSIPLPISLLLSLLFLSFTLALSYSLADWPVCSHLRSLICTTGACARMQVWSHVQATNTSRPDSAAPAPRSSMAFSGHGRSLFVMFGADFQGARSDAHVFDLDRRLWRRLETPRFVSGWVEATPALTPLHDVMYFWGSEGSGPEFVSLSPADGLPH